MKHLIKKQLFMGGLVVSSLLLGTFEAKAAAIIIDEFTTLTQPSPLFQPGVGTRNNTNTDASSILGTEREVSLSVTEGGAGASAFLTTMSGSLNITNGFDNTKSKTILTWDGMGSEDPGIDNDGLDANFSRQNAFQIEVLNLSAGDKIDALSLTVVDNDSNDTVKILDLSDRGNVLFRFEEYKNIDFAQIEKLILTIEAGEEEAVSASFSSFSAVKVPEPSNLLGLSLVAGLGVVTRKKKEKQRD